MSSDEATSPIDISALEFEAKKAYQSKRIRECLRLTGELLAVHPDNETGNSLQEAIGSDIERILNTVRALIENHQQGNLQGRVAAAEMMIVKVLEIDPSHKGATTLLQAVKALSRKAESLRQSRHHAEIPFTVASGPGPDKEGHAPISRKLLLFFAIAMAAGGWVFAKQVRLKTVQPPNPVSFVRAMAPSLPTRNTFSPTPSPEPAVVAAPVNSEPDAAAVHPIALRPAAATVVVTTPRELISPAQFGSLAVSSPVATDIYSGDQYLGATPLTVQLPAGNQTLEYRHANLRKTVTQVISPNETTTARVTFDVTLQINARPWAQVYLDGADKQPLGQTPLSNVQVPLGRVLVFENPQFPVKSYRVTGNESAIQVNFP